MYFDDIFANNFGDFWNNSTKFGEVLDISNIHFPTKFWSSSMYNLALFSI